MSDDIKHRLLEAADQAPGWRRLCHDACAQISSLEHKLFVSADRIAQLEQRLADADRDASELRRIGELIRTQDNRITDQPIFIVQQKQSYVTDADYNNCRYEWRETESGEHGLADPVRAKRLESVYGRTLTEPSGWKRFAVFDVWEFVTACFTEQGCKDYLAINGHNLRESRIYAEGGFRNHEYQTVRNWLKSLPAMTKEKQ